MDISNLKMMSTDVPHVSQMSGGKGASIPITSGKTLPAPEQGRVQSATPKDGEPAQQLNSVELNKLVDQANEVLSGRFSDLRFTVAEGTNVNVIRIEDSETGELIRQIPSEEMLAIARAFDELRQGTMLEEKA